ncbi:hypothetical protein [Amycolatopsis sp. FDAARGOS 1241]|uniref:hypothetical protein n=1 Tax=Amycolatopsis sp. FDAARGOS 1241 TaxID=2778070 RepID=UPI00194FEA58|nr:hypothetical protein [Amycolatopsis sp. FDAARGOS 1241]QRP49430.1 hypothetical protein I6J71_17730 [Amycolatopsis sp. FDAARGOS 1241]
MPNTSAGRPAASAGARTSNSSPPPATRSVKVKNAQHSCSAAARSATRPADTAGEPELQPAVDGPALGAREQCPPLRAAPGLVVAGQCARDRDRLGRRTLTSVAGCSRCRKPHPGSQRPGRGARDLGQRFAQALAERRVPGGALFGLLDAGERHRTQPGAHVGAQRVFPDRGEFQDLVQEQAEVLPEAMNSSRCTDSSS